MPRIGEYELGEVIASGAYAKVKHALHTPTQTRWAAKILPKTNKGVERDIRIEINVMRQLNHENVLRLNEILESQNNFYIILELAMGGDLCDMIMANPKGLPEKATKEIFVQIIRGLKACHANKVAHRDLKPENVLFTEKREVKISDFGLSRMHKTSANAASPTEMATTLTGTPQYVAPEVLSGSYDAFKADLWSLGCILFVMLTSRFPFGGAKDKELDRRILAGTYEKLPDHVSAEAADLISHLITVDVTKRYTIDDVLRHPFVADNAKRKEDLELTPLDASQRVYDFNAVDDRSLSPVSSPVRPRRRLPQ